MRRTASPSKRRRMDFAAGFSVTRTRLDHMWRDLELRQARFDAIETVAAAGRSIAGELLRTCRHESSLAADLFRADAELAACDLAIMRHKRLR